MSLSLTPLDLSALSPVVAKVLSPNTPVQAKMMAARGLAPMGPVDLVTVLYQLACDADVALAEAAKTTAGKLPEKIVSAALQEPLDARILHLFAERIPRQGTAIENLLLNRNTRDETFIMLASVLEGQSLEILCHNEERLLQCPSIIEALYFNAKTPMSVVNRLIELAVRNGIELARIPNFQEISESILGEKEASNQWDHSKLDAVFQSVLTAEWESQIGEFEYDEPGVDQNQTHETADATQKASSATIQEAELPEKHASLLLLPISAKIRLAMVGTAVHRSILIKDSNKLVALASIKSPAVSEQEAARYAANRSLIDEVIRYICNKKDWQRHYAIKLNLANNPKCPLNFAMHILPHLRANDLRNLARSKNIPSTVAKAAKEMLRARGG